MSKKKWIQLQKAHKKLMHICMEDGALEELKDIVDKKVMGYGTAQNEKIHSVEGLHALIQKQRKESEGMHINITYKPVMEMEIGDGNVAIIVTEMLLEFTFPDDIARLDLRFSTIWEWEDGIWKCKHCHGSVPATSGDEEDTWHLREWKQRAMELQNKVDEQTITLSNKNQELEIEAALERVRAKTMAMQKSEELKEVIQVLYDQFIQLNILIEHSGFIIDFKTRDDMVIWLADQHAVFPQVTIPYFDSSHWNSFKEAKEKGINFFANKLDFEEKNSFYKKLFTYIPDLSEEAKEHYFSCPGLAISTVLMDNVGLYIENFSGIPFSDEENNILMRFGKVFQQTYTRFLDLQKAEAQAREAQIEAALERVRGRTMAMYKSDELLEVGELLTTEIKVLGIDTITSGYVLIDKKTKIGWNYMPDPGTGKIMRSPLGVPHHITQNMIGIYEAWNKREPVFIIDMDEQQTISHQTFIAEQSIDFPLSAEELIAVSPPQLKLHTFNFIQGYLLIVGGKLLSEAQADVMLRFTQVFQQTYTRFLDLQKAEAQAREAQIEAALEKVRSRSLAMQKPDELQEVVTVVASKLQELGVILDAGGVILCTYFPDNKDVVQWVATPDFSYSGKYLVPYFDHPVFNDSWGFKNSGIDYSSKEYSYAEKKSFFEYAFEHSEFKGFPDEFKQFVFQSKKYALSFAWAKNSAILIASHTGVLPSESDAEILKRFSKVFEQAYIRFMDLQKAEKQAHKIKLVNQENERLLHSILPEQIVEQIKTEQKNIVKRFEQVSILFADIVGFTILSEKLKPGEVVGILNGLFSKFDDLTDKYGLEKIKTIGDAYMVAAGVPEENADHAMIMFHFAQDMLRSLEEYNQANNSQMNLRIGISSGPVVAGVIGKKKFAYDLWGDSVNTAARMEAYGQAGKIQVSPTSYELLKNDFAFEKIPKVAIKGKGEMDVYIWEPNLLVTDVTQRQ